MNQLFSLSPKDLDELPVEFQGILLARCFWRTMLTGDIDTMLRFGEKAKSHVLDIEAILCAVPFFYEWKDAHKRLIARTLEKRLDPRVPSAKFIADGLRALIDGEPSLAIDSAVHALDQEAFLAGREVELDYSSLSNYPGERLRSEYNYLWREEEPTTFIDDLDQWGQAFDSLGLSDVHERYQSIVEGSIRLDSYLELSNSWFRNNGVEGLMQDGNDSSREVTSEDSSNAYQKSPHKGKAISKKTANLKDNVTPPDSTSSSESLTSKTYLFTWNPKLHEVSAIASTIKKLKEQENVILGWSTGNRKSVSVGERVFLMRQGDNNPGIIGSGRIHGEIKTRSHWDKDKASLGKTFNQVDVLWDSLQETPLISLATLREKTKDESIWVSQSSGVEIPLAVAIQLEEIWEAAKKGLMEKDDKSIPSGPVSPSAYLGNDAIQGMGRDGTYKPSEHDSLDLKEQAKIFSSLMVAENIKPPFAIGLLGDWGVGKSFFMRLMQENVTLAAGKDVNLKPSVGAVSRVAQIEFNAWHYVDSDLWASLASHIFDSLSEELSAKTDEVEETRRKLRQNISSSQKEQKEANIAKNTAMKQLHKAGRKLEDKQREREKLIEKGESLRLQEVWDHVVKDSDVLNFKKEIEQVSKTLGIESVMKGAEDLERIYHSMTEVYSRGAGLSASLATAFTGDRARDSALLVAGVILVCVCGPMVLNYMASYLAPIGGPLIQLGAVIGTAVAWAGKNINRVTSALGYLEKIRDKIHKSDVGEVPLSDDEKALKNKLDNCNFEIAKAEQNIRSADLKISEAEAEIQRINEGGLVYDFLSGRVKDSRYLDRLGLISVIRQDFEQLGVLLRDWQKNGRMDKKADTDSNESVKKAPIERIVLYIDDLDRCPPERVVEVLQAVHLLLAFDLFVVVVAVDARWLERALNEAYNPLTETLEGTSQAEHRFNAHNYLEKIFQIPFSLPRMQEAGYRDLVGKMIAEPRVLAENVPDVPVADIPVADIPVADAPVADAPVPEVDVSEEEGKKTADEAGKLREKEQKEEAERREKEEEDRVKKQQLETAERIDSMLLTDSEEQFISGLYCFIDTPRLAKRLVNIYRLIRVRAASIEEDFSTFTDRDNGSYRAVLLLLAISVGRADSAPEILDDLYRAEGDSFKQWLQRLSDRYEENRTNLLANRDAGSKKSIPLLDRECRLEELREASLIMVADMKVASDSLSKLKAPRLEDDLMVYAKWAREVGRYSFRWHLKPKA